MGKSTVGTGIITHKRIFVPLAQENLKFYNSKIFTDNSLKNIFCY